MQSLVLALVTSPNVKMFQYNVGLVILNSFHPGPPQPPSQSLLAQLVQLWPPAFPDITSHYLESRLHRSFKVFSLKGVGSSQNKCTQNHLKWTLPCVIFVREGHWRRRRRRWWLSARNLFFPPLSFSSKLLVSSVLSEITHHKTKAHQSRGERTLPCAIFVREALEEVENGNWCSGFNWATWPPCGEQLWASPSHHIVILVLIAIIINMVVINIVTINVIINKIPTQSTSKGTQRDDSDSVWLLRRPTYFKHNIDLKNQIELIEKYQRA